MPRKTRLQTSLTDGQIEELEKLTKEKRFTKSVALALALEKHSREELEQKKRWNPLPQKMDLTLCKL